MSLRLKTIVKSTTFLAILATWLWSTAFVGVKIGLAYHTPFQFAGLRFLISGFLILVVFGNPGRYFRELKANLKIVFLVSLVQVFIQYALFYSGLNLIPGALGAMIIGSSPLFVAIVAHFSFSDDKMTLLKTLSFFVGIAGIAIITLGRTHVEVRGKFEFLGIGLLLLNNLAAGYSNVLVSKSSRTISPLVLSSTTLILGGLMLFLVSIPLEGIQRGPFPAVYFAALAWLSFLSAAAISIWFTLLRRPGVKVSALNVWKFLIPVSGALLSWVLLTDESPDIYSIAGMVVIAIALLILNFSGRHMRQRPEALLRIKNE